MRFSKMIQAVEAHAAGEPGRVIVGGVLDVPGQTMFDKMQWLAANGDDLRLRMLREPRGYPAANVNLVLPSNHPEADAGYVIMEQVEYPGMSGTNTICTVTVLLETGMLPMQEPLTELALETPAGLIRVRAACHEGKVRSVTFRNVPAFATHLDAPGEGPRHRAHQRDDQGGRQRAASGRPPRPARFRRHHHRPALRPAPRGDLQPAQRRDGVHRQARLGQALHLDGGYRPLTLRPRHPRPDGR